MWNLRRLWELWECCDSGFYSSCSSCWFCWWVAWLSRDTSISYSRSSPVMGFRWGGRVVYCVGLENRSTKRYREFESLPHHLKGRLPEWLMERFAKPSSWKWCVGSNPTSSARTKQIRIAGMAELAYALDLGSSYWGFESLYRYKFLNNGFPRVKKIYRRR